MELEARVLKMEINGLDEASDYNQTEWESNFFLDTFQHVSLSTLLWLTLNFFFFFFLSLNLSFCGFIFPSIKSFYSFPIAVYALAVDSAVSDCWFLCIIFTSRDLYRNVTNLSVWGIFYLYSSFFFVLHMWQWWDFWFCAEHFVDLIPLQIWIQGSHHKLIHNFIKITCICIFSANHTRWGFWFIRQCFPII